jgi:hypothetical protein
VQTRVHVDGKRPSRRGQLNVLGTGGASLVYLFDDCSSSNFLVDTGASRSVIPYSSSAFPSGPLLYAANGVRIKTWGLRELKLSFAGHPFTFSFILAAVDKPILGADFWHITSSWWTLSKAWFFLLLLFSQWRRLRR